MSTEFRNKDFKNSQLSKCPVTGAGTTAKFSAGKGTTVKDFWPNSLNLKILSQHSNLTNPMDKKFSYEKEFKKLNYKKLNKINLHTPKISNYSAIIAKNLGVRNILKIYQKKFINKNKGCVLEGRDASTKILPSSDVKFFFICNLNIAAKRRFMELKKLNSNIDVLEVKKALKLRNILDKKRKHSPLKRHKNAVVVNTGKLNKQAMVVKMSKSVEKILRTKYGN